MTIPILSGVYTNDAVDFRASYPVNMVPLPVANGISAGYLRPSDGLVSLGEGPGITRAAINWNNICYRVMGSKLCSIAQDSTVTVLGDVGLGGQCTMDYSFDLLAITSNGSLFYWDGVTLDQVTDPDLGVALTVVWVDGYFMTTDGTSLVVTELNDPFAVNPLKYGSSELDPDPVVSLLKLRNEIYAVNRYTIEVFQDIGGTLFPFSRITGAQIQKGSTGTYANCVFVETIAFLGSGRNEAPGVYLGLNSIANKISTREVDLILATYTDSQLSDVLFEGKVSSNQAQLWIHLPDRVMVYDHFATLAAQEPVWFVLTSAIDGFSAYRGKDLVWCYGRWLVGDSASALHGYLSDTLSTHWGTDVRWEFGTAIVYNEGRGAQFHSIELVALTGRVELDADPQISTSYSFDGESWSQERAITVGTRGQRLRRLVWFRQGSMRNWRIQRFKGDTSAFLSFAKLEAQVEPLAV